MPTLYPPHYAQSSHSTRGEFYKYALGIWFLYLVLSPIYIFPKGLPQPADMILLIGMLPGLVYMFLGANKRIPYAYLAGAMFVALTFVVNWTNYLFFPNQRLALSSLYYPYNFAVFLYVVFLFRRNFPLISKVSIAGITCAVAVQLIWVLVFPDQDMKRLTGGFKNPNQLAYWALLTAGMMIFIKRFGRFQMLHIVLILALAYLQTVALSKAGIIAFSVFALCLIATPQIEKAGKAMAALAVLAVILYAAISPQILTSVKNKVEAFERVSNRIETIGQENDDSPEGRGYNRIVNNPQYLLLGAGEGAFSRFRTRGSSNELHSGLATILFSYGIVGLSLFGVFLYLLFARQPLPYIGIVFAIMLFSVSSQTIRFTHTWVFFGIGYATFLIKKNQESAYIPPPLSQ